MLIVNADDLGRLKTATDAALSCYAKKRITSTSVMVFMEDSERAAELALSSGIDVGLHVNLSERFSAGAVPVRLRDYHDQICRFLTASKYALLLYHPWLAGKFRYVFEAQYAEFLRLYGRAPSHFDGHQHMHLASNMLIQRILPAGTKVRRSFSFRPGEKSFVKPVVPPWGGSQFGTPAPLDRPFFRPLASPYAGSPRTSDHSRQGSKCRTHDASPDHSRVSLSDERWLWRSRVARSPGKL